MDMPAPALQKSRSISSRSRLIKHDQAPVMQGSTHDLIQRAQLAPNTLSSTDVLVLQRTIGNGAVQRLLRQRSPDRSHMPHTSQSAMTVGPAGDKSEQEADRFARQVGHHSNVSSQPPSNQEPSIQRKVGAEGGTVDKHLENHIRNSQNGGRPMPEGVRDVLEPRLGADLGGVKVHTGSKAVQMNRQLGAKAFTNKNHIYYGAGQSPHDLQLTAHEAIHTIQQGAVQQGAVAQTKRLDQTHSNQLEPSTQPSVQPASRNSSLIQRVLIRDKDGNKYETDDMQLTEKHDLYLKLKREGPVGELNKLKNEYIVIDLDSEDSTHDEDTFFGTKGFNQGRFLDEDDFFGTKKSDQDEIYFESIEEKESKKKKTNKPKKAKKEKKPKKKVEKEKKIIIEKKGEKKGKKKKKQKVNEKEIKIKEKLSEKKKKKPIEPDYSLGEIVANTQAFLSMNLNRLSLWQTEDVQEMKESVLKGYVRKKGLIDDNEVEKNLPLPNVLGRLKDPGGGVGRNMQLKKQFIDKWERDDDLFDDDKRNRDEVKDDFKRPEKWKPTDDQVGHFSQDLIHIKDDPEIPRFTRDKKIKKGSSKWAPRDKPKGEFDYDKYDYDEMKEKGYGTVTDELGINFAAGPSGTIGDTLLAGRYLTKDVYEKKYKKKYKEEKLDKGILPSLTKKKKRKSARKKVKMENMREIATATIAYLTNEGHHSLLECILPLEVPLKLNLGSAPPEAIFLTQILPERLRMQFIIHLDEWIEDQFGHKPKMGRAVAQRIMSILQESNDNRILSINEKKSISEEGTSSSNNMIIINNNRDFRGSQHIIFDERDLLDSSKKEKKTNNFEDL